MIASCVRYTLFRCNRRSFSSEPPREPLNILFCGADDFSQHSLKGLFSLHQLKPDVINSIHVVHRPAKLAGKKGLKSLKQVPLQQTAVDLNLPSHAIDTFTGWSPPLEINLIVAVSFGLFIPARILSQTKFGGLNVHPSLLPDLRGASPIHHALLLNRPFTGITVQTLDTKRFDHGIRLLQSPSINIPNQSSCTPRRLVDHLAPTASDLLLRCIEERLYEEPIEDRGWYGNVSRDGAKELQLDHAPKITSDLTHIKWDSQPAETILRYNRVLGKLWDDTIHPEGKRISFRKLTSVDDKSVDLPKLWTKAGSVASRVDPATGKRYAYIKTYDAGAWIRVDSWVVDGYPPDRHWPKRTRSDIENDTAACTAT